MTAGLPDFYRGIDVAFQSLGQIINRPKYGGANIVAGGGVVTASDETELLSVSAKGMIYGGDIGMNVLASQSNGVPVLEVDGVKIAQRNFVSMINARIKVPNSAGIYLLRYNDINFKYHCGISAGITFETGFRILYQENDGETPSVTSRVIYAVV